MKKINRGTDAARIQTKPILIYIRLIAFIQICKQHKISM